MPGTLAATGHCSHAYLDGGCLYFTFAGAPGGEAADKDLYYRAAFDGFDPKRVAAYEAKKIKQLLANPGIIRNKLKIHSAVRNAKAFLAVQKEFGTFDKYIWAFVGGAPCTIV